jgi:hypothetical protein
MVPIYRDIQQRAFSHEFSPNSTTKAAPKEHVIPTLQTPIAKQAEAISKKTSATHLILGNQSIPKY